LWELIQVGDHLGPTIDLISGECRAHTEKLHALSKQASTLLGTLASSGLWLPNIQLVSFTKKAMFLYLAIAPAPFFIRKLHSVMVMQQGWGGHARMAHPLKRDLEWWRMVPNQHNGCSIYKPIEPPTSAQTPTTTVGEPC
jgi:hypothetical protein